MRVKVRGGTAVSGEPSLCVTCRSATIVKGARLRDEIVQCAELYGLGPVRFPVTSCSSYRDRRRPSVAEMEDIAWILRSDPKRNEIGFVRASSLKERERHVLQDE